MDSDEVKIVLKEKIHEFLKNGEGLEKIPFDNIKQVKEMFCLFKEAQISLQAELDSILQFYGEVPPIEEPPLEEEPQVELTNHGFEIGIAPPMEDPNNPSTSKKLNPDVKRCGVTMLDYKEMNPVDEVWKSRYNFRNKAFEEFKCTTARGKDQEEMIKRKKVELKEKRKYARNLCESCNGLKEEIQRIKKIINEYRGDVDFETNVCNNIRIKLLYRLKNIKADYQSNFKEVQSMKDVVENLSQEIRDRQYVLLESFYFWYNAQDKFRGQPTESFLVDLSKRFST